MDQVKMRFADDLRMNDNGRTVHIYRPGQPVEERSTVEPLSGEDVVPGFRLQL